MKIVIRMPNWLGDLVMATPILEEIRIKWPKSHITAICKDPLTPLLQNHPHLDSVLPLSQANHLKADLGILLTNSLSSAWHFFRQRIKKTIGYKNEGRSFLLTHPIPFPKQRGSEHLVDTYKRLLQAEHSSTKPTLTISDEEKAAAKQTLATYGIPEHAQIIGVNPAAAYGPAKCWLPERFHELTKRFTSSYFLYIGDASAHRLIEGICKGLGANVINLAGKTTIRELMALLTQCNVFLTNDSGPMHLAAALQTPLLALFGSTNDIATSPYNFGTIIHKRVSCSPCYKRVCPIDFKCMTQITVDEVEQKLNQLLNKHSAPTPSIFREKVSF